MTDFGRIRAAAWVMAGLAPALPLAAGDRAHGAVMVYSDSDAVSVVRPTLTGTKAIEAAEFRARWSVDVISAASVDLVSQASARGFEEERHEAEAAVLWDWGRGLRADAGWTTSQEPDFRSQAAILGAATEVVDRRLLLAARLGGAWADVGRKGDSDAWQPRTTYDLDVGASWVLSPSAALDLGWTGSRVHGFQSSPYRFVRVFAAARADPVTAVVERVPDLRLRQAATLRLRTRPRPGWFAHAELRAGTDDWGLRSLTGTVRAACELPWGLELEAELRGHGQSGTAWWQRRVTTWPVAPAFRTTDKELSPLWSALAGIHLGWTPPVGEPVRLGVGVDRLHQRYLDHPALARRDAWVVGADLSWEP